MLLCGIIKPDALARAEEIIDALTAASVFVLQIRPLTYTEALVEVLYDHMSLTARQAIAAQLLGKDGLALLLETASIEHLLDVIGRESDPHACKVRTVRARFSIHGAPMRVGNELWWENAFHRPIDMREAIRDLSYIFGIESSKK